MAALEDAGSGNDMKSITRRHLMEDVIREAVNGCDGWLVLVVDAVATRVLSSVVKMYDIMENRITLIENLQKKRQPFPEMEVIYLISPSADSIKALMKDFENPAKPTYGDVHLYFLSKVDDASMNTLMGCQALIDRVKTFKEINLNYIAAEAQVFHFDEPRCFAELFGGLPPPQGLTPLPERLAGKLLTVCSTLHEFPLVRFRAKNDTMQQVGTILLRMLDQLKSTTPWWYYGQPGHTERPQGTLLLMDRAEDCMSPAMHFCTYQAIVHDLLTLDGEVITYASDSGQTNALLNENDELWVTFRHKHIAVVIEEISTALNEFKAKNSSSAGGGGHMSLAEMADVIKSLPEYKAQLAKYNQHAQIAQECMRFLTQSDSELLNLIVQIEQTLATGFDDERNPLKLDKLIDEQMMGFLMADATQDDPNRKLRLAAILVASQRGALDEGTLQRVMTLGNLDDSAQRVLNSISRFTEQNQPAEPASGSKIKKKGGFFSRKKGGGAAQQAPPLDEDGYTSSRYVCPLKQTAEALVNDTLSTTEYPPVSGQSGGGSKRNVAQSVRRANPMSAKKSGYSGARSIIFVAGGVCHAELQCAYQVSEETQKEVILGSTSIITAADYIAELETLGAGL